MKNLPEQQYFYTSAFTESLLAHRERSAAPKSYKKGLLIKAYAPCIDSDHCLALCGNQKALGDWNPDKAALMSDIDFPEWQVEVDAGKISFPLEYKFVLYNKKERRAVAWENNPNRYMADPQIAAKRNAGCRRPLCILQSSCMERFRSSRTRILPTLREKLRCRRFRRLEAHD